MSPAERALIHIGEERESMQYCGLVQLTPAGLIKLEDLWSVSSLIRPLCVWNVQ